MTQPQDSSPADPATDYARAVCAGGVVAGPLVRAACKRHLADLDTGPARELAWDVEAAGRAIEFFAVALCLNGGEFEGRPFVLQPWQAFVVGSLFGWKGADGLRRFRVAYLEIGKGNGKSPMAAGIGLYMLVADKEARAEVYAAASKKDQALVLFRDAVAMVDQSPALRGEIRKLGGAQIWNLTYPATGSFFRAISSDDGQSGPRPHCGLLDEIHEHPDDGMVQKMRAGTKGRRQALIFMITNAGFDRETICWTYHDYARRVVEGVDNDDALFAFVCGLDDGDDWRDKKVWPKANPNLGVSVTRKYLSEQVREAIGMPGKANIVRRLNFCEWTETENAAISKERWDAVQADLDLDAYNGRPCWGGLDLSLAKDLTAFALVFVDDDGKRAAFTWFWTPVETIADREIADRASYRTWRDQGHLIATPGRVVGYGFVAQHLAEMFERFELQGIAFDEYRIPALLNELEEIGFGHIPLVKHPQGFRRNADNTLWMPESVNALEAAILDEKIRIKANPVLTWNAAGVVYESDAQGNRKFNKRKATGRIDGIVALAMAVGLSAQKAPAPEVSMYETVSLGVA